MNRVRYFSFCLMLSLFCCLIFCCSCKKEAEDLSANHVIMSLGKRVNTLDPALAADTTSQSAAAAFFDTLLQYSYRPGDYQLEPSMLETMPEASDDLKTYTCRLRKDLFFQDGEPFRGQPDSARRVTSRDVVFSLLRLADTRLQSPGFWVIRDSVCGLEEFRKLTARAERGDDSPYDAPCAGFTVIDETTFQIHLQKPNPRFLYMLALPYCAVVPRRAVEFYGPNFADHPLGSGPFRVKHWSRDYVLEMERFPQYRAEKYPYAARAQDRTRQLPLADRITCYLVKQPLSSWLMFLQGELDFYALDGDHFEAVVNEKRELAPTLMQRGIRLLQAPQIETNYIGFNFADPILGSNLDLRRAITLAFDKNMRVIHSGGRLVPAAGAVPPGVPGALKVSDTAFAERDLEAAKEYMVKAGYPGGIDPKTGRALELKFDQTGSDTFYRQTAELFANDLAPLGIEIKPEFNTRPRFMQKLAKGDVQLFRLSWTGDYPDAENFLQLFYSKNAGSSNRAFFRDAEFDAMYEEIQSMPDSPERTEKYRKMGVWLTEHCPWIFETNTVGFVLTHQWTSNYLLHDFAFNRWKYLSSDAAERKRIRRSFQPIGMSELR